MTAVLQEQKAEELPTQLKVRQSLVKSQRTGRRIADQRPLVKAVWISSSNEKIFNSKNSQVCEIIWQCKGLYKFESNVFIIYDLHSPKDWKNEEKTTDNCKYSCQP